MNPIMTEKMLKLFSEKIQLISEMEKEKVPAKNKSCTTVNVQDDQDEIESRNQFKQSELPKTINTTKQISQSRKDISTSIQKSSKMQDKKFPNKKIKTPAEIKPHKPEEKFYAENRNQEDDDEQIPKEICIPQVLPINFSIIVQARKLTQSMIQRIEQSNGEQQREEAFYSCEPLKKSIKSKAESKLEKKLGKREKAKNQTPLNIKVGKVKPQFINNIVNQIESQILQTLQQQIKNLSQKYSIDHEVIQHIYENKEKYAEKNQGDKEKKLWTNQSNADIIMELHKRLYLFFEKDKDCDLQKLISQANRILAAMGIPKQKHEKIRREWMNQFSSQSRRK